MANTATPGTSAAALTFTFSAQALRVILRDGEPWFVAVDVCDALTIGNVSLAVNGRPDRADSGLDADERGIATVNTPSGQQEMLIINESGLYSLILGSRKPEAKKFKKWVTSEVLPAIRKTGRYVAPESPAHPAPEQLTGNDMLNIKRMVWMLAHGFRFESSWSAGIWFHLRRALALPSPQPYAVEHLPRIAHELHSIAAASDKVQTLLIAIEQEAARRIFRKGECADLVVADMQRQAFARLDAMQTQLSALPAYLQKDVTAITHRTRAIYDHRNDEQPGVLNQGATA